MEGRGLGLSVAKQISHLHDGNLWVKSVEGEGSTFFVLFPHVLSEPKRQEKGTKKTSKILLVDSGKDQLQILSDVVTRWGFEPVLAKDGIEMVTMAYFHQPQVVLTGANLNKLSDENAAKIIKQDLQMHHVPIFACASPENLLPINRENSSIDGNLRLPLDRTHFERAMAQFQESTRKKGKKAA
jgi:CheY-like chemotaxis protein